MTRHTTIEGSRFWCIVCFFLFLCFVAESFGQFGNAVPRYRYEVDGYVKVKGPSLYFSETDIVVPGRGLSLEFSRYYGVSAGNEISPSYFGQWGHSFQWYLSHGVSNQPKEGKRVNYWVRSAYGESFRFYKRAGYNDAELGDDWTPDKGVRGRLTDTGSGDSRVFTYTTKHGLKYKFEDKVEGSTKYFVVTEITDRNGNKLQLHYDTVSAGYYSRKSPRLLAVTDTVGRVLKFHYGLRITYNRKTIPNPRQITKIEFGKGTAQSLTAVYQTINYDYRSPAKINDPFIKIRYQLGVGDKRGREISVGYEYLTGGSRYSRERGLGHLKAIVYPNGARTEFGSSTWIQRVVTHRDAPKKGESVGKILQTRQYRKLHSFGTINGQQFSYYNGRIVAHDRHLVNNRWVQRRGSTYDFTQSSPKMISLGGNYYWQFNPYSRNMNRVYQNQGGVGEKWDYLIEYRKTASNPNNHLVGNATRWKQVNPQNRSTVYREWTADYEDKFNFPIWEVDPMGHKTEFSYDSKGNLTEVKSKAKTGTQPHAIAHDIVTTHQYDSYGNRIKTTLKPSKTVTQVVETVYEKTFNAYPVEIKTTVTKNGKAHTIKTKMEWDVNRGLKTADIDAMGNRVEYAYWQDRKLKYTKDVAANLYTVPTYDLLGNVTQEQVRQNHWQTGTLIAQKKTAYDGLGRVVKVHSFKDNWTTPYATVETTYDGLGDVATTKDPRGLITTYTYDSFGRQTKRTLPDGDFVETRYNRLSQVTQSWTKASGTATSPKVSYTYDKLNRPLKVSYKTGESVSYTYDKNDNLLTLTTNDGSTTYTYTMTHDQLNRVKNRTDSLLGYKTFYEYDDAGKRTKLHIRTSSGTTDLYSVTYAYDQANRLTSVKDVVAGKTASYEYFDIGAIKTATLPNGITVDRQLDSRHRLDELQFKKSANTQLASLDYTYDVKSNVTKLVKNLTGAGGSKKTFTFGYDKISRLTSANYGNETVSYTYDKAGNRLTSVSTVAGTTKYTIAKDSNQLTYRSLVPEDSNFSTMNYTYDAEGKLTKRHEGGKSDSLSYGWGSKLKQIKQTRPGQTQKTIAYGYDGAGKRVKVQNSQGTRYFVYDGGMPVLELDQNKKIIASYLYGADGVVYRRIHGATKSQDKYEYHHVNALGSPIVLTDDSKTVVARYEYDVFGAIRSETGTSDNPRKFTGKEWDADVRLSHFGQRYYDPYIARFIMRDPAGDGINWYVYTYNNPLRFIDPDGLRALTTDEIAIAQKIFGDTINYDDVEIIESGVVHGILTFKSKAVVVHNNIYAKGGMTDDVLIHELFHVWAYSKGRIEPVTAGLTQWTARGIEFVTRTDDLLYDYRLDDFNDPNRRRLGDFNFEQQAAIIQDAYRYLYMDNTDPRYNDEFREKSDYWKEYYESLLEEFAEWHKQLQLGSDSYLTHN